VSTTIDVRGIDKAELLAALYNRARPLVIGFLPSFDPADMTRDEAENILAEATGAGWSGVQYAYFDYLRGRVMKINLLVDDLDPRLYDRDNGDGAAASVVASLRAREQNA
jgi:hypothetical protein